MGVYSIDVKTIVKDLMEIERQPLEKILEKTVKQNTVISDLSLMKNHMVSLKEQMEILGDTQEITLLAAYNDSPEYVFVETDASAEAGTFSLHVSQLAQPLYLIGDPALSTTTFTLTGASTLTLSVQFGSISQGVFTSNGSSPRSITIPVSQDTLSLNAIQNAIYTKNASSTPLNVRLSSINDGIGGTRAVWMGSDSGVNNAFSISILAQNSQGLVLSLTGNPILALSFDPTTYDAINSTVDNAIYSYYKISSKNQAKNALFTLYDIPMERSNNTVSDVIPGVELHFKKANDLNNPYSTLTLSPDAHAMAEQLKDFVALYNDNYQLLKNTESMKHDASIASMRRSLSMQMNKSYGNSSYGYSYPSDWGLTFNDAGQLSLNPKTLEKALELRGGKALIAFLGAYDRSIYSEVPPSESAQGFAVIWETLLESYLDPTEGIFSTKLDSMEYSIRSLIKDQAKLEEKLIDKEAAYKKTYSQLNAELEEMEAMNKQLEQQFKAMNHIHEK